MLPRVAPFAQRFITIYLQRLRRDRNLKSGAFRDGEIGEPKICKPQLRATNLIVDQVTHETGRRRIHWSSGRSYEQIGGAGPTFLFHKERDMKKRLLFAMLFAFTSFQIADADSIINGHRSVDPATLNLKSIKLGMSPAQVAAAFDTLVTDQTNVTRPDPSTIQCTQERLDAVRAHDYDQKVRSCISFEQIYGSNYSLRIDFVEDWPKHPGQMRVYNVEYHQLGDQTAADRAAFAEAVEKRYGKPTFPASPPGSPSFYCPITPARLACRADGQTPMTVRRQAPPIHRGLFVTGQQIFLYDYDYEAPRRLAQEKSLDELRTNKIKI